ncbi:MAG: right-handed parallel beta-helix repeat-containing protein [Treponema sp.]|jgi:hypothetical protein|nr:right-handed parallel beta-helix repeat-containing protein [Treponema sp.]
MDTDDSVTDDPVVEEKPSLEDVLSAISGLKAGENKAYLLPAGEEPMSPGKAANSEGPVTVTIDGGGRVVTLDSAGSLVTVENNVTLVLKNITLRGRDNNQAALVRVDTGGTLEMGTGVLITANRLEYSSGMYGGGVYVAIGGTFTMNGGEISGNSAGTRAGGVYVAKGGIFTMTNGKISGNSADFRGGGGVLVTEGGAFNMEGGEISDNSGGGVLVVERGIFTMTNGKISGNSAESYGGGVLVADA